MYKTDFLWRNDNNRAIIFTFRENLSILHKVKVKVSVLIWGKKNFVSTYFCVKTVYQPVKSERDGSTLVVEWKSDLL